MAIDKGSIKASYNYEVTMDKPFDARAVKPSKASLFDKESWSYDGSSIYIYDGMQVFVEDEKKTYVLVDASKFDTEEGWELLGTGASSEMEQVDVIDNLVSTRDDAALSANQGRILKDRIEDVAGEATRIYNIKGSTKYADLPMTGNSVGDVYNITDAFTLGGESYPAGTNVVWDGSNWDALGGSFDLSNYYSKEEVAQMVQQEAKRITEVESSLSETTDILNDALDKKVDKVSGFGLSQEDFTSALRRKLEELVNYDDTNLQGKVASLQSQLDTLMNDDSLDEVIAKYEELKAFLESLDNTELDNFITTISADINTLKANLKSTNSRIDVVVESVENLETEKQDVLVSGVNIVTINGQSLLGRGNINIRGGEGGNANVIVINSNKDFEVVDAESTVVAIKDENTTYAKIKDAVDNGYAIVLKEPRGNISYAVRADYVSDRILVYFTKSIGAIIYDIVVWVGLNDSLTCIISKSGISEGGNANVLVINSDKDFEVTDQDSNIVTISDSNTTYAKVKEAVDNGYTIVLKEPRGNISYAVRADYAVANSQGESRILLYFTKSIGEVTYDLVIWVGLNNSLTCIISTDRALEVDTELSDTSTNAIANSTVSRALAEKQERLMDGVNIKTVNGQNILGSGNIEIEGGSGGITEEKEVYIGSDEPPVGTKVWIDPTGTPSQPSQPSAGVEVIDNLESDSTTAALSANQGRALKEMIENVPSGGGGEGVKIYEVYASPQNDDELAANIKVYNAVKNGENAIYRAYLGGMAWFTATLASYVSSLVNLTFEFSQNAPDGSGLTATQFYIGLNSSGSPSYSSDSSMSIPSTSEVEKMIANVGGGAKIYRLPVGLFNSSPSNMYQFTSAETEEISNAIMASDTMFFIAIFDEENYKILNIPLALDFNGGLFSFTGNKVLVTHITTNNTYRLTMKIWEFHILGDLTRGCMVETEKIIYEA